MGEAGGQEAAALASELRAQLLGLLLFTDTQVCVCLLNCLILLCIPLLAKCVNCWLAGRP